MRCKQQCCEVLRGLLKMEVMGSPLSIFFLLAEMNRLWLE